MTEELLAGARMAAQRQAGTYCIVTSGLRPSAAGPRRHPGRGGADQGRVRAEDLRVAGAADGPSRPRRLKAGGVDRVNHNLNTSRRFYPRICTTHSYQDRLDTLRAVRRAGLEICSGGIVGMGEEDADVVDLALELAALGAEAVPINFLLPIPGIGLSEGGGSGEGTVAIWRRAGNRPDRLPKGEGEMCSLNPRYCLKVLALMRLANPRCELRIAAGREVHLGPLQPLGLYPANSIFVGDYLTKKGQPPEEDFAMIRALGFEVVVEG